MAMDTPVVFMVFGRPELTRRVLGRIRQAAPRRLTVIGDGPRPGHRRDPETVAATRRLIDSGVDWPCELLLDYSDTNLGCGPRIASGLTAAFKRYDRAIVLEDDTLPEPSFFDFCETMLDRYADDPGVVHISGSNSVMGRSVLPSRDGYCLNRLPDIWGWASWSRAWSRYDFGVKEWGEIRETNWLETLIPSAPAHAMFSGMFDTQLDRETNPETWDWSWIYQCLRDGRTVTPLRNLVSNLGFDRSATHTRDATDPLAEMPSTPIDCGQLNGPDRSISETLDEMLLQHRFLACQRRTSRRRLILRACLKRLRRIVRVSL